MIEKYENVFDEFYDEVFKGYKKFIEENSEYNARVVKYNTNTSTYFPLITCVQSDNTDTNYNATYYMEKYEAFYFTINIYAKDKTSGTNITVASQKIIKELRSLTIYYFTKILNMKKTGDKPTPNLDISVLRQTQQYQCLVGNVRGNIIRR